ncbi:Vegetative incompatibility protein HET-E-1 [Fusarium oxysporum f. sp. conglutinans]|nr:Vegetative incompatibility protein HET-E-1 [Fusarium oxysporum f. sp. conglutinans]
MKTRLKSPGLYSIGWIAALPIERAAATALLHDRHDVPEGFHQHRSDANSYTWGRIGEHNVVIASLSAGVYGLPSAATTVSDLIHSLPHIRIGLLVGIGAGIALPDEGQDIRLGDIVVSQPDGMTGGVVQYDLGKAKTNGAWERKGSLDKPPPVLLHALASLQAEHEIEPSRVPGILQSMLRAKPSMKRPKSDYTYQGAENDRLFESQHDHVGGSTCDDCESAWEVKREQRESTDPEIHYGIIASGNKLIKDAAVRDSLLEDTGHQCLCVEMEAAGLMDRFPCLVIRGICDYADSHKNDQWQRYAAATAAAFAVELLEYVPAGQLEATEKVAEVLQSLEQKINNLSVPIQKVDYRTALNQLPIAEGASFDSRAEEHNPTCLPGTRVELLKAVYRWIGNPDSKTMFWLSGMAGTGKSTIARTVAQRLHERGDLSASFFFKRGETDRGNLAKFMPTLARQLASRFPDVTPFIKKAIDGDSEIVGKVVSKQFENLIGEPLERVAATRTAPLSIMIVVDALDECAGDSDIKLLLDLLSHNLSTGYLRTRVLITSRPELPVRLGFRSIDGAYHDLELHKISQSIIELDICVFLHHEFANIRKNFNEVAEEELKLPEHWPGEARLMKLTIAASPLFIFAATICRFISDSCLGSPDELLQRTLRFTDGAHTSKLGMTYSPVLEQQVISRSGRERCGIVESFRLVVGTIVTLASPLSMRALALLLDVDVNEVTTRLRMLHSVLDVPESLESPVRLLHLSFRDYLAAGESEFGVDVRLTHQNLAKHCLRVMRDALHENICGLSFPGMRRSTVDSSRLEERISPELQYACMYWVYHQIEGDSNPTESDEVHDFLTAHLLHWLEALSLLGRASECLNSLKSMADWLVDRRDSSLSKFVPDAVRFLQANFSVITEAPLQIYSSCLIFAPSKSIVRKTFTNVIPRWISTLPKVQEGWDACLLTLEGHSGRISSVVFSHDSTNLASASIDKTIRIWNAETGDCEQVLEGHSDLVTSVVFSHDSKKLASASYDETVRMWNAETGRCEQVLEGHSNWVYSVVFSHDSTNLASASIDKTIRIWNADTGDCEQVLEGHSGPVTSVVFSHDSTKVASASWDMIVRMWNAETGRCEQVLEGHSDLVTSVVFSHDSTKVASASDDKTVRIWNAQADDCEQVLEGHNRLVYLVVFSHDSKKLASASWDWTVRIWNAETGDCEQVLEGHSDLVTSVVFSHDSKKLASASWDRIVRMWNAETGRREQVLEGHSDLVTSVVFSHDSTKVASASDDKTVRIWNAETGKCEGVISSGAYAHDLPFTADERGVFTDGGVFALNGDSESCAESLVSLQPSEAATLTCKDSTWVTTAGADLLWLPPECRGGTVAITGNTVAIGCRSGRVILLGLSATGIAKITQSA